MSAIAIAAGVSAVSAATSLGTGIASSQAGKSAAKKAAQASAMETANQTAMSGLANSQARSDYAPYMESGQQANTMLSGLLGMSSPDTLQPPDISQYQTPVFVGGQYITVTNQAAYYQAMQSYTAQKTQLEQLGQRGQLGSLLTPYGAEQYKNDPGYMPMVQTLQDLQATPGYQFQLQQGQQSVNNSAAARGSLLSGGTMKAMERFGQGLAGTSFNDAFNRAQQAYQAAFSRNQSGKAQTFSMLSGMSGQGLAATGGASSVAMNTLGQANSASGQNAQAQGQAAYQTGQAQSNLYGAINQGVQGAASNYLLGQYLNQQKQPVNPGAVGGNLPLG